MMRAGGSSAGFGRRLAALLYDALLLAALLLVYSALAVAINRGHALEPATGVAWVLYRSGEVAVIATYFVVNWTRSGQTLGMRAWGLHAVDEQGRRLRVLRALLRFVWATLAWLPGALGVLFLYLDPEHLPLHDRLSRTRLLYVPRRG